MYVRSSVVAADQTFRVLGERHKAARKEDKVQRAAARDVPALQECIHLTADGVLGALEVCVCGGGEGQALDRHGVAYKPSTITKCQTTILG